MLAGQNLSLALVGSCPGPHWLMCADKVPVEGGKAHQGRRHGGPAVRPRAEGVGWWQALRARSWHGVRRLAAQPCAWGAGVTASTGGVRAAT